MLKPLRLALILMVFVAVVALGAGELLAQQDGSWPAFPMAGKAWRGPGFYLSWTKIIACWAVFAAWVWTTDWVSRDARQTGMDYLRWNPIVVGSFMAAFILVWLIPTFWLGFPLLVIAYVGPLVGYVFYRNSKLESHQRVLTPEHLRWWAAQQMGRFGVKMAAVASDPHSKGSPVQLLPRGGPDERTEQGRLLAARQAPGLRDARQWLADGLSSRATAILLDYTQQAVNVQYMVDGVWLPREPQTREAGDPVLEALKTLCGLNPQDRQSRQEGKFVAEYSVLKESVFKQVERSKDALRKKLTIDFTKEFASPEIDAAALQMKVKMAVEDKVRTKFASKIGPWTPVRASDAGRVRGADKVDPDKALEPAKALSTLTSQGTPTGERVVIQFEEKLVRFRTLEELGMRQKLQEQTMELLGRKQGFILLAATPASGLRTTTSVNLRVMDRLVRDFAAVEDESNRYDEIENVPVTIYKSADGQTPASVLPKLFLGEPNVVIVRDLVNAETTGLLCDEVAEGRLIVSTIRAKDAVEALLRVVALGVPPAKVAGAVTAVLAQRLVRKLCESCREPYAPPPQVLQQLGIPEGRIPAFYRPPQQQPDDVCITCGGVGYIGRTAIFELLVIDDTLRQLLAATPKLDILRQAARKAGMRSLQDEGILLVAKGITSLPELMRAMK